MSKLFKRVTLSVLCAILVACAVAVGAIFGLNSRANNKGFADGNGTGASASSAAAAIKPTLNTDYDYEITIKAGTTPAEKAAAWDEAISYTGKSVLVKLEEDWVAPNHATEGTSFGLTSVSYSFGELYVPSGSVITLDLNGKALDRHRDPNTMANIGDGMVIWIEGGTLNLIDTSAAGNGKITGGFDESAGGGVIMDGGTFNMYGGEITENKTTWGGGVSVQSADATFKMFGGKIYKNITDGRQDGGGGVYVNQNAKFYMYGGEISGNQALDAAGGGVAVVGNCYFEMNGGKITDNQALAKDYKIADSSTTNKAKWNWYAAGGGGVYAYNGSEVVINDGEISYNYGLEGGGVKVIRSSNFTMNGGIITRNISMDSGWGAGGLSVGYTNSLKVTSPSSAATPKTVCEAHLNGGQIVDNNRAYKSYSYHDDCEGVAIAKNSTVSIGGPVIIANNRHIVNAGSGELWVETSGQISVSGKLVQNGKAAQIGVFVSDTSTLTNIIKGFTADYLCGYEYYQFFYSNVPEYQFDWQSVNSVLKFIKNTKLSYNNVLWYYQTADTTWHDLEAGNNYARVSYGEEVIDVKATYTEVGVGGVTHEWTWKNTVASQKLINLGNASGTSIRQVNNYSFAIPDVTANTEPADSVWISWTMFTLEVVPRDITVVINADTNIYGETITLNNGFNNTVDADLGAPKGGWQLDAGSSIASWDSYSDLGVKLKKVYGYNVGTYAIMRDTDATTSSNYNITYVNATYTITSRPVTIILNDDWGDYGATVTLNQKPVLATANEKSVGDITAKDGKYYDSEGNLVDGATSPANRIHENGKKVYKGGWRYADNSKTIVSGDSPNNVYPVVLSTVAGTTGNTAVGTYDITVKFTNANYTVTFLKPDETAFAAGNDPKATYSILTLKITVKDPDTNNKYNEATYDGNAKNIDIPNSYITLKGGVATSTIAKKYRVFASDASDLPTSLPAADPTDTFWSSAQVAPTQTAAGEYKVYTLITADHHDPLVKEWTFTIGKDKAAYTLTAKHGTDNVAANGKVSYDGVAVVVDITFSTTGANKTNCPVQIFYKGTNSGNTYGTSADATYKDDSANKAGNPLGLGSSTAPIEAGEYTATVIADPTATNAGFDLDTNSTSTFSFTIEAQKVAKPSAAVAAGSSDTYNGNVQTINYVYDTAPVKALTSASYTSVSEMVSGKTVTYKDLTFVSSTPNTTTNKTTSAFTAKDAGDYAVEFELNDTRNYNWNDADNPTGKQVVKFTIKQAELTIAFTAPNGGGTLASDWSWKPETEWDTANGKGSIAWAITNGICTPSGGSADNVTLTVSYYTIVDGVPQTGAITVITDSKLDITNTTTFGTGSYAIFAMLADDSTADNVNKNYKIKDSIASGYVLDSTIKVVEQEFTVGSGSISANSVKWSYYTSEKPLDFYLYDKTNTEFKYQLINDGNGNYIPLEYTLIVDVSTKADSLPLGVLLNTSDSTSGFVNGFKTVKVDNGTETVVTKVDTTGTFRTYVSLKVDLANGATVRFKDENGNEVTEWNKYCIDWEVKKGDLDLSGVKWKYEYTTESGVKTGSVAANDDGKYKASVEYEGVNYYFGIDESTLPVGLTVKADSNYASTITTSNYHQRNVGTYTANVQSTDLSMATGFEDLWNVDSSTWSALNLQLELTKKNLFTATGWTTAAEEYNPTDFPGSYYRKSVLDTSANPDFAEYIEYKYYETDSDGNVIGELTLEDINAAVDLQVIKHYVVKAFVKDEYKSNYDMFDGKEDDGTPKTPSAKFETGSDLEIAEASITDKEVVYNGETHFLPDTIKIVAGTKQLIYGNKVNGYTVTYYKGNTLADRVALADGEYPVDAGHYFVEITLSDTANTMYVLNVTYFRVEILPKPITVPQIVGEITYNGDWITLSAENLDSNYDESIMEMLSGGKTGKNAGGYTVKFRLLSSNYIWVMPEDTEETEAPAKGLVKVSLAVDGIEIDNSELIATLDWTIAKIQLKSDSWNLSGKDGAVLNALAAYKTMIEENELDVRIGYRYYDMNGNLITDEELTLKPGGKYLVQAFLDGEDAGNFEFGDVKGADKSVTAQKEYNVPKSGMAKFKDTLTKSYMGLPLWAWIVIGVASLLFLIILICIIAAACKKKKKKKIEEEEKKREKEEAKAAAAAAAAPMLAASAAMADQQAKLDAEKAKMEAELARSRAEAEAAAAKAKAQAEMDLQKAKMEAEMSKMRAEAEAQAKQMRADAEAQAKQMREQMQQMKQMQQMQQQPAPQPQPMPQPQMQQPMQPQYQQQNNNETAALMELKAEMAAMRAEQRMVQMQMQYRQQPAPAPAPQYSQPAQTDVNAEVRARLAEERAKTAEEQLYRSAEQRAAIAEDRLLRGAYTAQPMSQANVPAISNGAAADNAEVLGAVLASMVRNLASNNVVQQEKISEITQVIEAESQPVVANTPTVYPPDAVITTTTTVDTTNKRSVGDRREETIFDTDGFYDQFDGNK